jgi:hypothetical protein
MPVSRRSGRIRSRPKCLAIAIRPGSWPINGEFLYPVLAATKSSASAEALRACASPSAEACEVRDLICEPEEPEISAISTGTPEVAYVPPTSSETPIPNSSGIPVSLAISITGLVAAVVAMVLLMRVDGSNIGLKGLTEAPPRRRAAVLAIAGLISAILSDFGWYGEAFNIPMVWDCPACFLRWCLRQRLGYGYRPAWKKVD